VKLYSHVVKHDTGLAPNPFHGFCTSAVCTPSHAKARLKVGDWLIGNSQKKDGHRLVYAMQLCDVLSMNEYFQDSRFQNKKPKLDGAPEEQCGDNFYYQDKDAKWKRLPSRFHNDHASFVADVGKDFAGRPVFAAEHFYYFGRRRVLIPKELAGVIWAGRNVCGKSEFANAFVAWLQGNFKPGILAAPRDIADHAGETGVMITGPFANGIAQIKNQESESLTRSVTHTTTRSRGCG